MRRRLTLFCALALVLAAGAETGLDQAEARPQRAEVHERSLRLFAIVEASNGYRGWVETQGHKRVTLTLRKGETTIEARTSGRVTRHGIDARFGSMGRISVRFRGRPLSLPRRGEEDGKGRCRGRDPEFESGLFSGTIRFRGENGFTELDSKSASGYAERRYRRVCRPKPKEEPSIGELFERLFGLMPVTALRAHDRVDGANALFAAAAIDFRPIFGPGFLIYAFSAQTVERRDGMRLRRSISAEGGDRSFHFRRTRKAPRAATVRAPKPFTGTAKYRKEEGSPASWLGSIVVRLPGAGPVAMSGPGFKAGTCNVTFAGLTAGRCLPGSGPAQFRSPARLSRLAQGSGSQSQLRWDARLSWSR